MKKNDTVSIIIVSYNEGLYLRNAIESCLSQKYGGQLEIIIGDDGSDDGSVEIINEYCKRYPSIVKSFVMDRSDSNEIIPSIRVSNIIQKAYKESSGEFFLLLSGDDMLLTDNCIKNKINFLKRNKSFFSCYSDYKRFWESGKEMIYCSNNYSRKLLWAKHYIHISCFLFRRNVWDNRLDRFCDDTGLMYSILLSGKTHHISGVDFGYRQRNESIMHRSDQIELNILEIALFQDVVNHSGLTSDTMSRFSRPLIELYKNRDKLKEEKYTKYIKICHQYPNDFLSMICKSDRVVKERRCIMKLIIKSVMWEKMYSMSNKVFTDCKLFNK